MATEKIIEIQPINVTRVSITIEGDTDVVLNQMNARTIRELTDARKDKKQQRQVPNIWEDIITAVHWRDGYPVKDTYLELEEHHLHEMLTENAPCITAFGLKKSFNQAVVRNELDKYSTKFDNAINIIAPGGLVPITFVEHYVDEKLMSPKKGAPVLSRTNRFTGWRATFDITCMETVYSVQSVVNVINMAGFGLGIGSGRSSGYGRYHVIDVK